MPLKLLGGLPNPARFQPSLSGRAFVTQSSVVIHGVAKLQLALAEYIDVPRTSRLLSDGACSASSLGVAMFRSTSLNQFSAALCVVLALLFVVFSLAHLIDENEHSFASHEHSHSILGELTAEPDHVDDHHKPLHDDGNPDTDLATMHHHHWDNGSATILLGSINMSIPGTGIVRHERQMEHLLLGADASGFERPPKPFVSIV